MPMRYAASIFFFFAHRCFIISEMRLRPAALIPPGRLLLAVLVTFFPLRCVQRFLIPAEIRARAAADMCRPGLRPLRLPVAVV